MAITAQALASAVSGGPALAAAGQFVTGPGDAQEPAYRGTATFTGDGVATTATLNWIDGTAAIPFTPTAVACFRAGGTDTAAGVPFPTAISNTSATITWSVAIASTKTQLLVVYLFK